MNLTPTQKADELIEKFENTTIHLPYIDLDNDQAIGEGQMTYLSAIQCAIIAVDEILIMRWNLPHYGNKEGMIFWQEVKTILTDRL